MFVDDKIKHVGQWLPSNGHNIQVWSLCACQIPRLTMRELLEIWNILDLYCHCLVWFQYNI